MVIAAANVVVVVLLVVLLSLSRYGGTGRDLQVNCCQESYVYVLSAVRFATVMGCKDCTVVIGAAAGMVRDSVT